MVTGEGKYYALPQEIQKGATKLINENTKKLFGGRIAVGPDDRFDEGRAYYILKKKEAVDFIETIYSKYNPWEFNPDKYDPNSKKRCTDIIYLGDINEEYCVFYMQRNKQRNWKKAENIKNTIKWLRENKYLD